MKKNKKYFNPCPIKSPFGLFLIFPPLHNGRWRLKRNSNRIYSLLKLQPN